MWNFNIKPTSKSDALTQVAALAAPQFVKNYLTAALGPLPEPKDHYSINGLGDGKQKADVTLEVN